MGKKKVLRLGILGSLCVATFVGASFNVHAISEITVSSIGSYSEGAGVTFSLSDSTATPSVYYSVAEQNSWTQIDSELIREEKTGYRADILGLSAGTYDIKISDGFTSKTINDITVSAYDRSGYAHFNYANDGTKIDVSNGIGAYNNDGSLKAGAYVVYVSDATKNTVTLTVGNKTYTGIVDILNSGVTPLDVRILDTITTDTWTQIDYKNNINVNEYSSVTNPDSSNTKYHQITIGNSDGSATISNSGTKYTQEDLISAGYNTLQGQYETIDNLTSYMTTGTKTKNNITYNDFDSYWNMCNITSAKDVTVEGVGDDAGLFQWGFTWSKCSSIEVRNLTFDDYPEDACSFQAGDTAVSAMSDFSTGHLWVHQNTFNEGMNYWDVSYEQDKHEGDGATDFKGLAFVTVSYNHYINNHKTGLVGGSDSHSTASLTFHHNYYQECQARLPFARQANMHMYNNYYYGSTGNNMQIYAGAYAFIENCYFENNNKTFVFDDSSNIGTPAVKSYNNTFNNCSNYSGATIVEDRTTAVASGNKFGTDFDTNPDIFYYDSNNNKSNVSRLDDTIDVPTIVPQLAGAGIMSLSEYEEEGTVKLTLGSSVGTYTDNLTEYSAYRVIGMLTNVDDSYISSATIQLVIDTETKDGVTSLKQYDVTTLYKSLTENGAIICPEADGTYYFYFNIYGLTEAYDGYSFTVTANVRINDELLSKTLDTYTISLGEAETTYITFEEVTSEVKETTVYSNYTINATSSKSVDKSSLSNALQFDLNGVTITSGIALGGSGSQDYRNVEFTVSYNATITVYYNGVNDRYLTLYDSKYKLIEQATATTGTSVIQNYTYSAVSTGTYYIASAKSGINVYAIVITYN